MGGRGLWAKTGPELYFCCHIFNIFWYAICDSSFFVFHELHTSKMSRSLISQKVPQLVFVWCTLMIRLRLCILTRRNAFFNAVYQRYILCLYLIICSINFADLISNVVPSMFLHYKVTIFPLHLSSEIPQSVQAINALSLFPIVHISLRYLEKER